MRYGVTTQPSERGIGEWLTLWSGAFSSDFEGQGIARPGAKQITLSIEWQGQVVVKLPKGVTFPRTDENYESIDAAINEQVNAHVAKLNAIPDLPPGDDGRPTEHPDPVAPGADDI
ncbi:hypothetical protein SEA_ALUMINUMJESUS_84 [Microbacterium phage AluminumJesus]|nr:hypothetical protein SEA_ALUMINUMJESUS_84 [Microbacterium phage AluminumJesus]UVG34455.1 hypothetical protein SEA_GAZEBO_86 [Microbacterium phage Gazebo]